MRNPYEATSAEGVENRGLKSLVKELREEIACLRTENQKFRRQLAHGATE